MDIKFGSLEPDAPMVAEASNPMDVKVSGLALRDGGTIGWSVYPRDPNVVVVSEGEADVVDGTAKFDIGLLEKPPLEDNRRLLVSVWDGSDLDADHYSALYNCALPYISLSFDNSYAWSYSRDPAPFVDSHPNPKELVQVTGWARDLDDDTPIRNLSVIWRGSPNNPTKCLDNNNQPLVPGPENSKGVVTKTNGDGHVVVKFANSMPSIIRMTCDWNYGQGGSQFKLVYSDLGSLWLNPEMDAPSLDTDPETNILNLDDWPDVPGIPATLVYDGQPWMQTGSAAAIWVNNRMLASFTLPADFQTRPVYIDKTVFMSNGAKNRIAWTCNSPTGANGHDSFIPTFLVVGDVPVQQPPAPSPQFDDLKPYLQDEAEMVNASLIAGGLLIYVPPTDQLRRPLREGDRVTATAYLEAFYPGTSNPRRNVLTSSPVVVAPGDIADGFSFLFSEDKLKDYASDEKGNPGSLRVQLQIVSGGAYWSGVLKAQLSTA